MRYFEKIKPFAEEILNFIRENKNPKLFIHTFVFEDLKAEKRPELPYHWDEKTDKVLYGTFGMGLWCDFNKVTTLDKFTPSKILSISFIEDDTENKWAKSIKGVKQ